MEPCFPIGVQHSLRFQRRCSHTWAELWEGREGQTAKPGWMGNRDGWISAGSTGGNESLPWSGCSIMRVLPAWGDAFTCFPPKPLLDTGL